MFSTWFIVTCSLTCAAGVLYTYLELSSCKFLLERVLDPFVHFLYPSLPPRWWAESFISSGVLSVFRFTWNKSLFMPNKWCVLFYWLLVCLDIPGEFDVLGINLVICVHNKNRKTVKPLGLASQQQHQLKYPHLWAYLTWHHLQTWVP